MRYLGPSFKLPGKEFGGLIKLLPFPPRKKVAENTLTPELMVKIDALIQSFDNCIPPKCNVSNTLPVQKSPKLTFSAEATPPTEPSPTAISDDNSEHEKQGRSFKNRN